MNIYASLFRPKREPERTLYDAFQAESEKRSGRSVDEWLPSEAKAVLDAAAAYAQEHDLRTPTMYEVLAADRAASGHLDYGAKWALYVSEEMRKDEL